MIKPLMEDFKIFIRILSKNEIKNNEMINIDCCKFLTPTILLPLIGFAHNNYKQIKHHKNPKINNYLNKVLGNEQHTDTTFPFKKLDEKTDNSEELTNDILRIMKPKEEMNNALKYIFYELINNVYDHSSFDKGFVMGQRYPKNNLTNYCFMDNGIGIPGSFENAEISFKNDCNAILKAINGMSTRDSDEYVGRGTGLNSVVSIVTQGANGDILIASGKGVIEVMKNRVICEKIPQGYIKGTLISINLKSNKSIDIYEYLDGREYKL
ncbi:MAG: ATP-binding protein [Methanobrevibacter wolinii]